MKSRLKIFTIVILLMSSFMVACSSSSDNASGNGTSNNDESQTPQIDENNYYIDLYDMDEDLLNEIISKKNDDVEIPYNENGYSAEELDALILSTNVKISSYAIDNPKGTWKTISGNIYDIDDEYIYILTCGHSFVDTTKEYEELGINNLIKEVNITFINGEKISFNPNSIYINRKQDVSLVLLDKNLVSFETLNIIRSINIDHMYQKNLDNTTIYEYAYSLSDKTYIKYYALIKSTTNRVLDIQNTNIVNGCSGGGFFDNTGTYCGMTYNSIFVNYIDVIPTLYELIILANPNY